MPDCITASSFFFMAQDGKIPIMCAAGQAQRELIEILFPKTRPIPSVQDWSIDGIIRSIDSLCFKTRVCE